MSTMEYTKATFTTLHGSKDMSLRDIVAALESAIGSPTDMDWGEDGDGWVTYAKTAEGSHWPSFDGVWEPTPWKEGQWALKFTLSHSREYDDGPLSISVAELGKIQDKAEAHAKSAGFEPGLTVLTSYSWYNGSDEPEAHKIKPYTLDV